MTSLSMSRLFGMIETFDVRYLDTLHYASKNNMNKNSLNEVTWSVADIT